MPIAKWIIIDIRTRKALYGWGGITLKFDSHEEAKNLALQMFFNEEDFWLVDII